MDDLRDAPPRKRLVILGSTGSIGRSALEVVRHYPDRFEIVGLAAHSNAALLARQIAEFGPAHAALTDTPAGAQLAKQFPKTSVWTGPQAAENLAALDADMVLCAMVGAAGLRPIWAAIEAGNDIALANKEPLVMAGPLIMAAARRRNVQVLPVDSEHSAIFQCIHGYEQADVRCIHLTASGGPFYGRRRENLRNVTPEEATHHPTWDMGAKISVDSATLMNKGLEIIEAMALFDLPEDRIETVIHPQSVVHSLVEFTDGNILAHLGITDMKFPILFALTYPERVQSPMARLDLTSMPPLTFAKPDFEEFPCLHYARCAAAQGGTAPAVLNAANEEAVQAFCHGRIPFLGIAEVVRETVEAVPAGKTLNLESVAEADRQARQAAAKAIAARA